ncbi:MAG: outer membrane beta-barrel protein [Flavobacteriales bacterium]
MKRLLILIGLICSFQTFAQVDKEFGLKLGYNLTNIADIKGLTGFEYGIFYKKMFSNKIALDLGLNLRKQKLREDIYAQESDVNVQFFSIPVTARYYFNKELYGRIGLQPALITNARIDESENLSQGLKRDVKNHFNAFSLAGVFGIGYTIDKTIDIQVEYNMGLTNKFIEPSVGRFTETNHYLSVSFGYILFRE